MKTLFLFDSYFGNTEQVTRAIANAFNPETTIVKWIRDASTEELSGTELLIIGSPTRGFRATEAVNLFFKEKLPTDLHGMNVAAFDTRIDLDTIKSKVFRVVVNKGGYAANTMAKQLKRRKARLVIPAEGFLVTGEQGPLKEGELERAFEWGKEIANSLAPH